MVFKCSGRDSSTIQFILIVGIYVVLFCIGRQVQMYKLEDGE